MNPYPNGEQSSTMSIESNCGLRFIIGIIIYFALFPTLSVLATTEGVTVIGNVTYKGRIPKAKHIEVSKDRETCGAMRAIQNVQVSEKKSGLQEAVVSLDSTHKEEHTRPPATSIIANRDCLFIPSVTAMMKGDSIEVQNRDSILHNTHIKLKKRTILNVAHLSNSLPITKRLKRAGFHNIRCDKHRFMGATLHVFDHPWYSVTDTQGAFQIHKVPPGPQTIQVWHEVLGILQKKVTIPSEGTISINFEYSKNILD